MHVRRKYVKAEPFAPTCAEAIELIGKLYEIERDLPNPHILTGAEQERRWPTSWQYAARALHPWSRKSRRGPADNKVSPRAPSAVGEIRDGALLDSSILTPALSKQDGGPGTVVRHGLDIHGNHALRLVGYCKRPSECYMGTCLATQTTEEAQIPRPCAGSVPQITGNFGLECPASPGELHPYGRLLDTS
jgi:hypothetical protein